MTIRNSEWVSWYTDNRLPGHLFPHTIVTLDKYSSMSLNTKGYFVLPDKETI